MPEKKRYLIGYRDSAVVPRSMETIIDSLGTGLEGARKIRKLRTGQSIVEMTGEQAVKLAEEQPDLIIEEDRELEMFLAMPGLMPRVPAEADQSLAFRVLPLLLLIVYVLLIPVLLALRLWRARRHHMLGTREFMAVYGILTEPYNVSGEARVCAFGWHTDRIDRGADLLMQETATCGRSTPSQDVQCCRP